MIFTFKEKTSKHRSVLMSFLYVEVNNLLRKLVFEDFNQFFTRRHVILPKTSGLEKQKGEVENE